MGIRGMAARGGNHGGDKGNGGRKWGGNRDEEGKGIVTRR